MDANQRSGKSNPAALLPIGVFLVLYLGCGLLFEYGLKIEQGFYQTPAIVIFLIALAVACFQYRKLDFNAKMKVMAAGVADENILTMCLVFLAAGAFSGASREGKTGLFEQAHHGTIFLDEIGEIPVALQAKLLRVLQEKEVRRVGSTNVIPIDVRGISATNVNIQQQIQQGKFRSDLLYRLNTLEIHIPPLRERPEDILPLIEHQMRIIAAEQGTTPPELTPEAQELLKQYRWPGNVRELRNICERIVVMSSSRTVDQSTLMDLHIFRELPPEPAGQPASPSESLPVMLPQVIRKKDLAKELGVSRTTLWRMSKRLEQQKEQQT